MYFCIHSCRLGFTFQANLLAQRKPYLDIKRFKPIWQLRLSLTQKKKWHLDFQIKTEPQSCIISISLIFDENTKNMPSDFDIIARHALLVSG